MGTIRDPIAEGSEGAQQLGPERARVYSDLSPEDKDRYNADIRTTNIILQGLPKDIYTLINQYTEAKDIWDNVKMLLEGSELTKEDRESQLYNEFEHFCQNKGETIHDYYVWFAKLINDMRNIKMTMSRMQGLRDSNYDQLYAYLKQHEAHANENKMMLDRFTQHTVDPLALLLNVSHQQYYSQSSTTPPHFADNTQLDSGISLTDNLIEKLTNTLGRQNKGQGNNVRGAGAAGFGGAQNRVRNANPGQARHIKCYNCNDNSVDEDVDEQPVQDLALNVDNVFQANDCDAFDSDVDEAPTTQTMFIENLSSSYHVYDEASLSYDLDILSEMHDDVQPNYIVNSHADYSSDSNMIPYDQYVKDNAVTVIQSNVSSIPNDAYMMILNDIYEPSAQCVSVPTQNNVVDNSLTAELATYKDKLNCMKDELRSHQDESRSSQRADHNFTTNQSVDDTPNTPATLVPKERGFEQTKECYLTEVIPLFKTLKEHFKGIQKALTKEIQEIQEIFEKLEAEVDQNVVNRKHDEIERKNLLIANDNLIANCLSKEVFYIATNYELTVSRFTEMHAAHTVVQARCLELKAELSKLLNKVQKDDLTELVKRFSILEVNHFNLQLKYQNLKESFGNNTSSPTRDAPKALDFQITQLTEKVNVLQEQNKLFRTENAKIKQHYKELYDSIKITRAKHIDQTTALLTENENMKAQIHENLKCITMDLIKPRVLTTGRYAIDVEPIPPHNRNNREVHLDYLKHLKESVETLCEIIEEAKVERPLDSSLAFACLYTKHSQELLEYAIGTCQKDFNQLDKNHAATPLTRKKQVTFEDQLNSCIDASGSQPRSNTKKNRILSAKSVNQKKVEEHPRTNKSSLKTMNRIDSSISSKITVVQIVLWYLDSGCSKHMTGDRSRLRNFVKKFIRIVRFGNDHFGAIMGYEDYVIGGSVIFRVEDMMKSSPICLLSKASKNKSWLWHRRLNHLNFSTINDLTRKDLVRGLPRLKFEKDHLCSACQLGKSKKHTHTPKAENTNLEVLNTLHMDLCGPMRVQTINGKKYILVIVDDYSRFTCVKLLKSKDETLESGIGERQNRTLVEAARTMLIFSKALMFP
ncbi:retrovirus-related pol polyprotein from transposon TNT 1-94 [Tanacetum coccineum]